MNDNTPQTTEASESLAPGGLTWFEVATERAVACYSAILGEILIDISQGEPQQEATSVSFRLDRMRQVSVLEECSYETRAAAQ